MYYDVMCKMKKPAINKTLDLSIETEKRTLTNKEPMLPYDWSSVAYEYIITRQSTTDKQSEIG